MTYDEMEERREDLIRREAGKAGLRGRINGKCIECIYDPGSGGGNWKQQVSACTDKACPLWYVRPLSESRQEKVIIPEFLKNESIQKADTRQS